LEETARVPERWFGRAPPDNKQPAPGPKAGSGNTSEIVLYRKEIKAKKRAERTKPLKNGGGGDLSYRHNYFVRKLLRHDKNQGTTPFDKKFRILDGAKPPKESTKSFITYPHFFVKYFRVFLPFFSRFLSKKNFGAKNHVFTGPFRRNPATRSIFCGPDRVNPLGTNRNRPFGADVYAKGS
jgi:hypothetical protein